MKNQPHFLPTTRREFLHLSARGIGLLAFTHYAPSFLVSSARADVPAPRKDMPILVLVQLAGGNDGLNTVVPYEDDRYYRLRPTLHIAKEQVLKLDDQLGFNPACAGLHQLAQAGKLAIIQNVGYPNPNRSHFRSTDIWETASDRLRRPVLRQLLQRRAGTRRPARRAPHRRGAGGFPRRTRASGLRRAGVRRPADAQ